VIRGKGVGYLLDKIKYKIRIRNEKLHYSNLLRKQKKNKGEIQKIEPKVDAFYYAYDLYAKYIIDKMKHFDLAKYVLDYANKKSTKTEILSLGSGTGDWEIDLITQAPEKIRFELQDINKELLKDTKIFAEKHDLDLQLNIGDANQISLDKEKYDFIVCRSSLHHFTELEHVFSELNDSLVNGGEFLVMGEVIGRNGEKLYPETREVAQKIFDILPEKFRYNNYTNKIDTIFPDIDHSKDSFESIRSEEIFPLLRKYFKIKDYVAFDAFLSLFLDFRYGPNYDLNSSLDKSLVEMIGNLDIYYISNSILKPTCLFGIFGKNL